MDDQQVEDAIQEKGLDSPRVEKARIDGLMEQVQYHYTVIPGTTTTVAVAMLAGFTLAIEYSACVSPENFDPVLGTEIAKGKAERAAREALWAFEGYRLAWLVGKFDRLAEWSNRHGVSLQATEELDRILTK